MLYKIKCSFEVVVDAESSTISKAKGTEMERAFIYASEAFIKNPSLPKEIVEMDDGYEMEAEEMVGRHFRKRVRVQ